MTIDSAQQLRFRLKGLGLSDSAIGAVWPRWWSDEAEQSSSAQAELRFGVARRLGLDPRSLFEDQGEPQFLWREEARFKHVSGESDVERAGITSFGRAVAGILVNATTPPPAAITGASASDLRQEILAAERPYIALVDLLTLAWAVGIPVIHLRVFPWPQKRMAAMTVMTGDRWVVLLGKDSKYPATIAFYLAHELGHIALGHVATEGQIVDLQEGDPAPREDDDDEERSADAFALELLTGEPQPKVLPLKPWRSSGGELARVATGAAAELGIEPGTLALCFGYSTGNWQTANVALRNIYPAAEPVWAEVNRAARSQLDLDEMGQDAAEFLEAVLGDAPT